MKATIPSKTLRWIKVVNLPVVGPDGQEGVESVLEVQGKILLAVADADRLGLSPSSIRRYLSTGALTAYNENGTKRTPATTKGKIHFDLRQWRDMKFEQI